MIPIQAQPEPADFETKVRAKGAEFLAVDPNPTIWTNREYWQDALPELYELYSHVCAYTALWIPRNEGVASVDHFIPKSAVPAEAYEWRNFRLTSLKMNSRKREFRDVIDPFVITPSTFQLKFPSLMIFPNPNLARRVKTQVAATIKRLKLNRDDGIKSRLDWLLPYCDGEASFGLLRRKAPFIAYELERQGKIESIVGIMRPDS